MLGSRATRKCPRHPQSCWRRPRPKPIKTTQATPEGETPAEDKATPEPPPKAKTKAYYAVPTKGIYRDYRAEVLPALKGEKGAVHCKFDTEEEAKVWLSAYEKGEPCESSMLI